MRGNTTTFGTLKASLRALVLDHEALLEKDSRRVDDMHTLVYQCRAVFKIFMTVECEVPDLHMSQREVMTQVRLISPRFHFRLNLALLARIGKQAIRGADDEHSKPVYCDRGSVLVRNRNRAVRRARRVQTGRRRRGLAARTGCVREDSV